MRLTVELHPPLMDAAVPQRSTVAATLAGQTSSLPSTPPISGTRRLLDLPVAPGDSFTLWVTVGPPGTLTLRQDLNVTTAGLVPAGSNSPPGATAGGARHPRVALDATPDGPRVRVDLTFLDTTDDVRKKGLLEDEPRGTGVEPVKGYDGEWEKGEPNPSAPHHGCILRILELTAGRPKAWAVVVPPALFSPRSRFNVLLFFGPAPPRDYKTTVDCPQGSPYVNPGLERYTKDPPTWAPFFWAPKSSGSVALRAKLENGYAEAGVEGQLAASGRPVMLVMPIAHNRDVNYEKATGPELPSLLNGVLAALAAGGVVSLPPRGGGLEGLDGLAVAGFSAGGKPALDTLFSHLDLVREIYLLDSTQPPDTARVSRWFSADSRRRVRLVGGFFVDRNAQDREAILAGLGGRRAKRENDVSITPADQVFFNTPGNIYHAAMFLTSEKPGTLDPVGTTTAGGLSEQVNVHVKAYTPPSKSAPAQLTIESEIDGKAQERVVRCSPIEAAGMIRNRWWKEMLRDRVDTVAKLDELSKELMPNPTYSDGLGLRHQWTFSGGVGNPKRYPYGVIADPTDPASKTFEGYLHWCLKDSTFT